MSCGNFGYEFVGIIGDRYEETSRCVTDNITSLESEAEMRKYPPSFEVQFRGRNYFFRVGGRNARKFFFLYYYASVKKMTDEKFFFMEISNLYKLVHRWGSINFISCQIMGFDFRKFSDFVTGYYPYYPTPIKYIYI